MADDRNRFERNRFYDRDHDFDRREDDGYIARRGFGNRSAGYDRSRSFEERREPSGRGFEDRSGFGRGGSFGRGGDDRSGFERGGSYRRDHEDRFGGYERDFGDSAGYGTGGSARDWRDVMGEDRGRGSRSRDDWFGRGDAGRYGASDFGRGSRGDDDERGFFERAGDEIRSWFTGEDEDSRHHRGRGPKNYQRSDERIREDVNDRLTDDPYIDASEIEVSVQNREVTLTGTVNSRFEKRRAEDLAESVSGVAHVQNNLRVGQTTGTGVGSQAQSGTGDALGASSGSASGAGLNLGAMGTGATGGTTGTDMTNRSGARRRTPTA